MSSNDRCGFCGECESSSHTFWDCKVAAEVWKEMGLDLLVLPQPTRDFVDVVWVVKKRKKDMDWVLFAITAWNIWNNKSKFKHTGTSKEPSRIVKEVREYGMEIKGSQLPRLHNKASIHNQWKPPREGRYKVNVYGANFANLGCCGARVVIRNKESLIMGVMSKKIPCPLSATEVEAKALEEGIQLA